MTEEINKKVSWTLSVRKLLFSECSPLFGEHKTSVNQVKIKLELTEKQTDLNQVKPRIANTFTRN